MPRRNFIFILAVLVGAVVIAATVHQFNNGNVAVGRNDAQNLAPVAEAIDKIHANYYREVDDAHLVQGALQGVVESLDAYSTYVKPDKMEVFERRMAGDNYGTGLKVDLVDQAVVVIGPLVNSPAHRMGLSGGDRVISIDGQSVSGLSIDTVRRMLDDGPPGDVDLVINRGGQRRDVQLARERFQLESITGLYRGPDGKWIHRLRDEDGGTVAYIRIREFVDSTAQELSVLLKGLMREPPSGGLVLDLRDNPGGTLSAATGVADLLMARGTIVEVQTRSGRSEIFAARDDKSPWESGPLVVLVNAQTASAAEIVAGSLWANARAVLVGSRTRGKGCVQTMLPLRKGLGQINLTTAEYFLADRLPISRTPGSDQWGIDPQLQVLAMHEDALKTLRMGLEVIYKPTPETMPAGYSQKSQELVELLMSQDNQLAAAVKLLNDPAELGARLSRTREELDARRALMPKVAP